MDWLTSIGISLSGLPWWAAFILAGFALLCREGVGALLRWRKANLDKIQYDDSQKRELEGALVAELKSRVAALEVEVKSNREKLEQSQDAHSRCEVEQARLQGKFDAQAERMNAMQIQIDGLLRHEIANVENVKALKQAAIKIDPNIATELIP